MFLAYRQHFFCCKVRTPFRYYMPRQPLPVGIWERNHHARITKHVSYITRLTPVVDNQRRRRSKPRSVTNCDHCFRKKKTSIDTEVSVPTVHGMVCSSGDTKRKATVFWKSRMWSLKCYDIELYHFYEKWSDGASRKCAVPWVRSPMSRSTSSTPFHVS